MEKVDVIIIGAGAVGLAVARELAAAGREVVVLERHQSFGRETSSRNSEVIHAGMYYPRESLKARLCVQGAGQLREFCTKYRVPCRRTGKLIIACSEAEIPEIERLYHQGERNGVRHLALLDRAAISAREPRIKALLALWSPDTAIFDSHAFMQTLETLATKDGALFAYGCRVTGIVFSGGTFTVALTDTDGQPETLQAASLINSAGLHADKVAAMAGIDPEAAGYKLFYSKGEYYSISGLEKGHTNHLVYPVPGDHYLGIHTVLDLQGQIKLGPNAYYVDKIDYTLDESHKEEFYTAAKRFLPALQRHQLIPDMTGIRPKLQGPGDPFRDFIICHEEKRGLPGLVNLIGVESPGLTSSLAIAARVRELLSGKKIGN